MVVPIRIPFVAQAAVSPTCVEGLGSRYVDYVYNTKLHYNYCLIVLSPRAGLEGFSLSCCDLLQLQQVQQIIVIPDNEVPEIRGYRPRRSERPEATVSFLNGTVEVHSRRPERRNRQNLRTTFSLPATPETMARPRFGGQVCWSTCAILLFLSS